MINWLERLLGQTQARVLGLLRRSRRTVGDLSADLALTDNAVRGHVAALTRDGLVRDAGQVTVTAGKPPRLYELTPEGEELFPKAYAAVLRELLAEVEAREGREGALALLRAVGRRAAAAAPKRGDAAARVTAAADALRGLGADVEVARTKEGWKIQGYACPLSAVTSSNADACEVARSLVEEITGRPVAECCERGDRPRCAFAVS